MEATYLWGGVLKKGGGERNDMVSKGSFCPPQEIAMWGIKKRESNPLAQGGQEKG